MFKAIRHLFCFSGMVWSNRKPGFMTCRKCGFRRKATQYD